MASIAGNGPIVFVASPNQAVSLRIMPAGPLGYEVLSSGALSAGTVMAVAANALASAVDAAPTIESSSEAVLHYDDALPAAIGTPGSPNVVAAPAKSSFPRDLIGLRLIFDVSWTLRAAGAVAWLTGATW